MPRERHLKVYCWQGFRPTVPRHHREVLFFLAAHSRGEARALAREHSAAVATMALVTDGEGFLAARARPGVLLWKPRWRQTKPCPTCGGCGRLELPTEFRAVFEEDGG